MTTRSGRSYTTEMTELHEADGSTTASKGSEGGGGSTTTMELMLGALLEDRRQRNDEIRDERERRDREMAEERSRHKEETELLRGLLEGARRRDEAAMARCGLR